MSSSTKRKQIFTVGTGVLLIVAMLAGAYYAKLIADGRRALASADPTEIVTKVTVCEVAARDLPVCIRLRGFLEGFAEVRVHAEVTGAVVAREASDGDAVNVGEILCRVDDTFHRLTVQQAEASLRIAQANRDQAQAAVEAVAARLEEVQVHRRNCQIEFDRIDRLHKDQHAPQIEFDRADTALQQAMAAVREAEAALRRATQQRASASAAVALGEAELARAAETLERCSIRSPLAGRVDRMLIEVGEYVVPGQPVADVIRLDRMKMFVEVSSRQLALLGEDVTAEVAPDAFAETVYAATLHHAAPRADPVSRKFRLELHVENPDGRLLSGTFAECRLSADKTRRIVTLPASALVRRHGRDYCYAVARQDDILRARLRPIETRPVPDLLECVEVIHGLAPGDQVVTESQAELRDGTAVTIPTAISEPDREREEADQQQG
jgi:multidrug efflux pump subunit AcrA (membrane-fusion protein)